RCLVSTRAWVRPHNATRGADRGMPRCERSRVGRRCRHYTNPPSKDSTMFHRKFSRRATAPAALIALLLTATAASAATPVVSTENGKVRGADVAGDYAFRGLPYAAAPVGDLRWRAPRPAADWKGVRDATQYAPSSPQGMGPSTPEGPQSEDSLYL